MVHLSIPAKLILSLAVGAVLGFERESKRKAIIEAKGEASGLLGVRTFSLITTLGTVAGLLRAEHFPLFLIINISFMALLISYYILHSLFTRDQGITTEVAIIFAYLIGVLIALEIFSIQLILAMTVTLLLILSKKETIQAFISGVRSSEINAFISYAIIAIVILPFLPKQAYRLTDIPMLETILSSYGIHFGKLAEIEILNPSRLWFVVALITGVDLLGYVLERTIGQKKGWLLTSIAGGFISSTATTQSLARQSKQSKTVDLLVAAAIFANLASFFQVLALIAPLNSTLLVKSTTLILAIIVSAFAVGMFFLKVKKAPEGENLAGTKKEIKEDEIFALSPALKFAVIFSLIKITTKVSLAFFGNAGFLAASGIAAITGIDAVTINLTEMAGQLVTFQTAVITLVLVNAINLISKSLYSFVQGKREFALKFSASMAVVIAASLLGLLPFI